MKKLLIAIAFLGLFTSGVFAIYTFNLFINKENQRSVETEINKTTGNEDQALQNEIKNTLVAKYGQDTTKLDVSITEVSGNYAKGEVSENGVGGGLWFAAKINGIWQLVYDGNGIIKCSDLNKHPDFPTTFIPQCFDELKGFLIVR